MNLHELCPQCRKPIPLTKAGKLRRGRRFCSAKCQRAAINDARLIARSELVFLIPALEDGIRRAREALETLGMLKVHR